MTKLKLFFMLSMLLGGLLLNTQLATAQTGALPSIFCALGKEKVRHRSGPEVANRVKEMQRTNRNVRWALEAFERNEKKTNRRPKIDDATSVTFDIEKKSGAGAVAFLKTSFTSSQLVSSGSIEIISIPTYQALGEWQGTILVYKYDAAGYFVDEYIADVMLLPDPTYTYWDAILEVSYDWEGAWLQHGTYDLYDKMGTPVGGWPATSGSLVSAPRLKSKPQFQKAGFAQGLPHPHNPRPSLPSLPAFPTGRVKKVLKCATLSCATAAAACGVGSIFFSGAPFAPCLSTGCTGAVVGCTLFEIFG